MLEIQGIAVSDGISFAKAYCLKDPDLSFEKVTVLDIQEELERFKTARGKAKKGASRDLRNCSGQIWCRQGSDFCGTFISVRRPRNDCSS